MKKTCEGDMSKPTPVLTEHFKDFGVIKHEPK